LLLLVLQLLLLPGCLELLLLLLQHHPVLLLLVRRLLLLRRQAPLQRLPQAAARRGYRAGGTVGVHRLYSQLYTAANTPRLLLPVCS
jgi:hypothetical protein